jgi:hypothetical protein
VWLVAVVAMACNSPTAPGHPDARGLGRSITTASFEFRHAPGDTVDVGWQEAFHAWATADLGVSPTRRIVYHKYFDRDHMRMQNGHGDVNAYADPVRYELHTIWPTDFHEVIHLYASAWGRPVALWSEGLAVSYQVDPVRQDFVAKWNMVPLHTRARQLRQQGRLIPIPDLLTTTGFRSFDAEVIYPESGSFMLAVRAACGLDGVRRIFQSGSPDDTADLVREEFAAACGRTIDDLETEWLGLLDSASPDHGSTQ